MDKAKQKQPEFEGELASLVRGIRQLPLQQQDEALNRLIISLLQAIYPAEYFHVNRALGLLANVQQQYCLLNQSQAGATSATEEGPCGPMPRPHDIN